VFEPCDCPSTRDAWQRYDPGADPGGYDLPGRDPGGWQDVPQDTGPWLDIGMDGAVDVGPWDEGIRPDPGPDASKDVPDAGECAVPDPEGPFYLEVSGLPGDGDYWPDATVSGEAVVVALGDAVGTYVPAKALHLRMTADDAQLQILWNLGPDIRIPVSVGQTVRVYVRQVSPWWRDLAVVLWDANGVPLFFAHDGARLDGWFDCDGFVPCPTFHVEDDDCPAVESTCGTAFHVPIFMWLDGGLSSSEAPIALKQGGSAVNFNGVRYFVHHAYRQDQMGCVDYPGDWFAGAAVRAHFTDAMGCGCKVSTDCGRHEVCETRLGRCVPDRCTPEALGLAGKTCPAGGLCDPFTGTCLSDVPALVSCNRDLDCGGGFGLCNLELRRCGEDGGCDERIGGVCVADVCEVVDCDARYCSPLQGRCADCLADCDCAGDSAGMFCNVGQCHACDPGRIGLTQENGGAWEFYELCATGPSSASVQVALRAIDPSITCGVSGVFAKCEGGQIACHGSGFDRVSPHGMLDDATWARLCDLSLRDDVTRIVGGHYL
jgi:hypothetical protein